jgi:ABC-type branched-subunit amino acid transport system ATPase component
MSAVDPASERAQAVRAQQLQVMGLGDRRPIPEPLRAVLTKVGWRPLAMGALTAALTQIGLWTLVLVGADLTTSVGLSRGIVPGIVIVAGLAFAAAGLTSPSDTSGAAGGKTRPVAFLAGAAAGSACLAAGLWGLLAAYVLSMGLLGEATVAVEPALLETYGASTRVRIAAVCRSASVLGVVVALVVATVVREAGGTWRAALLTGGVLMCGLVSVPLERRSGARFRPGAAAGWLPSLSRAATIRARSGRAQVRRARLLYGTANVRPLLLGYVAIGACSLPLFFYGVARLGQRWGVHPTVASAVLVVLLVPGIAAVLGLAARGEALLVRGPARLLELAAACLVAGGLGVGLFAEVPSLGLALAAWTFAMGVFLVAAVALDALVFVVVPPELRVEGAGLRRAAFWAAGLLIGFSQLANLERRLGVSGAMASLVLVCLGAAASLRTASRSIESSLLTRAEDAVVAAEVEHLASRGALPMLACQGVDFSYGQIQVLFDVDFTVREGELVALLGTNGAGKSTLLKAISGLGVPSRGSVRFEGQDVAHLGAESRVGLGITQVPGGHAVFGPLTVVDNLRLYAYSLGRSRRSADETMDVAFDTFPRLAERRNQMAQTLSGGEQHMLGLARALLLRPKLLLIDELSLGLAPKIVSDLLDLVRRINADGTAVVVVEQSVNVALSIANHAYFMEKGEIRFDGRSADLLDRKDLLRAIFLGGAAARISPQALPPRALIADS